MNQIQLRLKELLAKKPNISVAEFMQNVIPFYYANNIAIGKDSDFITAPEVSQLFGEMIAICIINHCINSKIKSFNLIEFGPGRGTLMNDILRTLKQFESTHSLLNKVYMLEGSQKLKKIQQGILKEHKNIIWQNDLEKLMHDISEDSGISNILIANEFFDCLPIRQYIKTKNGISEIVIIDSDKNDSELQLEFSLQHSDYSPGLKMNLGEVYEQNINYDFYCDKICQILDNSTHSLALIIDYGYIERPIKSTLQALKNHKYHSPLEDIGYSDLTALVNFTELSKLFQYKDMKTDLKLQAEFLHEHGIVARMHDLLARTGIDVSDQVERLTDKDQMGALFKVLIVGK